MKVGYLGPIGTFTYMAAKQAYPTEQLVAYSSIPACIKGVESKEVELAIVPIENTIEGTVNSTLDYLYLKSSLSVMAEVVLPIAQNFLVHPANLGKLNELKKVLSHPQAISQSQTYLLANYPDVIIEETASTSYAAQYISQHPEKIYAAIAPLFASETYNLEVISKDIQDIELNQTRFWVLGNKKTELYLPKVNEKISLGISMPNNLPGALHKALSAFAWRNINLNKIESRPLKTSLGEYFFLMDVIIEQPIELINLAIAEVELLGGEVRLLGTYQVYSVS